MNKRILAVNKLRLLDGQLVCNDGTDVKEYLRAWAKDNEITGDVPLSLLTRSTLKKIDDEAFMYRNACLCA